MKNNPIVQSLIHAVLAVIYISLVALIMSNGERIFGGGPDTIWIPIALLTLFVLSAAIMGVLILGRPILMYVDGHKTAALKFFGYTLGWLALILVAVLVIQPWR